MKTTFDIGNDVIMGANAVYTTVVSGKPGKEVFKIYVSKSRHVGSPSECLVFDNREDFAKALMEISFGEHSGACKNARRELPKMEASYSYDFNDVKEWLYEEPKKTTKKQAKKK